MSQQNGELSRSVEGLAAHDEADESSDVGPDYGLLLLATAAEQRSLKEAPETIKMKRGRGRPKLEMSEEERRDHKRHREMMSSRKYRRKVAEKKRLAEIRSKIKIKKYIMTMYK